MNPLLSHKMGPAFEFAFSCLRKVAKKRGFMVYSYSIHGGCNGGTILWDFSYFSDLMALRNVQKPGCLMISSGIILTNILGSTIH